MKKQKCTDLLTFRKRNGIFFVEQRNNIAYSSIDKTVGLVQACGVRTWHCL